MITYLDMDGVLCDLQGYLFEKYPDRVWPWDRGIVGPEAWRLGNIDWPSVEFEKMKWTPFGRSLARWCQKQGEVIVLTAGPPGAGKEEWVKREMPGVEIIVEVEKWRVKEEGDVLVDDKDENVELWGSGAVLVPRIWNSGGRGPFTVHGKTFFSQEV